MIVIKPYDPLWPERFRLEAAALRETLGHLALRVDHVGSTSVPGLAAKPVIDIQISVPGTASFAVCEAPLARLGYRRIPLGDFDLVYPYFRKPADPPASHHVHLCAIGSSEERRHLAFRAYLRDHPEVGEKYVVLKRYLASIHHGETQASRERYSTAKTEFIERVLVVALAEGYPRLPVERAVAAR